jgi:ribosomal-protein-alanine N-acetyltransferase
MNLKLPTRIETDRLVLQRLRYEDAEEIFDAYACKSEATKYVSWPTHESITDTHNFLKYAVSAWEQGTDYSFSIRLKKDRRLVGGIGAVNDEGKIQIGYIISPSFWGNGIATEACKTLVKLLSDLDEIYRIGTFVDADHGISAKVLDKCGFMKEARLEKWFRFINQGNAPKDCILYRYPLKPSKEAVE